MLFHPPGKWENQPPLHEVIAERDQLTALQSLVVAQETSRERAARQSVREICADIRGPREIGKTVWALSDWGAHKMLTNIPILGTAAELQKDHAWYVAHNLVTQKGR